MRFASSGLAVTAISATEWRVSDPSHSADDPFGLIGFIQKVGAAFEVTVIGRPRERCYCPSFDAALQHLNSLPRDQPSRDVG